LIELPMPASTKILKEPAMVQASAYGLLRRFGVDKSGATAIEYALIAASIGAVLASTVWALGGDLKSNFYDKLAAMF
jgi:Flp pilus assembly pilin Flp